MGSVLAKELLLALNAEILKAGGYPLVFTELDGEDEIFFKHASDEEAIDLAMKRLLFLSESIE